ncbi:MAG: sodium/sugar symporter [Bacteroidales bacterium]|nr:sodium/sugar symporter [Bacteroidales bacterium]
MKSIDYIVFIIYGVVIVTLAMLVSREKKGHKKNAEDYFLASKALPWWAIGTSLIASNISAEQFIGMSGSGYAIGLAIASYEWMAALTLIIVAKFLLPVFLKKGIYTMPQFLEMRYDSRVRTALAVFWILVYIFVNLTSVLYMGALALETIMGVELIYGIIGLALFAAIYSIYGGLKAVAWTDVVQVIFLIGGGLVTTFLALQAVSERFDAGGLLAGFGEMLQQAPGKFEMILSKDNPHYTDLPGIGVLVGGLWVANLFYWGFNQYIIQRGLAAKSIRESQRGLMFAGYLKLLIPLIVVIPGIAAYVLTTNSGVDLSPSDKAYPWLLHEIVPPGITGLAFAALIAAVVSSLASMLNSTSTIFTMDIYREFINRKADNTKTVLVGRLSAIAALIIAVFAARPLLSGLDQAFQYIQNFTGMVSPGVLVIFVFGIFWKRTTANAALWVAILTIPMGILAQYVLFPEMPFLDRMGYIFLILSLFLVILSVLERGTDDPKGIQLSKDFFRTGKAFNIGAIGIILILIFLYVFFW